MLEVLDCKVLYYSQVENASEGQSGLVGDWSEVLVPVPFIKTFSSSWYYTFTTLQSSTVYDVIGLGRQF